MPKTTSQKVDNMFFLDQNNASTNVQLSYNYFSTSISKSSGQENVSSGKPSNISCHYALNSSTPALVFPDSTQTYTTSNIYLYGLVHNNIVNITCDNYGKKISALEIVNELIIEHTPVGGTGKIYVCVFLTYDPIQGIVSKTDIDSLVALIKSKQSGPSTINFELNASMQSQSSAVVYSDDANTVIVLTNPISINAQTAGFLKSYSTTTPLFSNFPKNQVYSVLTKPNINASDRDDLYIDCNPVGESAETISTYAVPINSEYTAMAGKIDLMSMVVQMSVVFMFILTSYFLVPIFYKKLVIDNVNKLVLNPGTPGNPDGFTDDEKSEILKGNFTEFSKKFKTTRPDMEHGIDTFVRIGSIDMLLSVFFVIFFLALVTHGFSNSFDFNSIATGLYLMVFFVVSVATLQFNKLNNSFLQTKLTKADAEGLEGGSIVGFPYPPDDAKKGDSPNFFNIMDVKDFLGQAVNYIISGWGGRVGMSILIIWAIMVFIIILCILDYSVFPAKLPDIKSDKAGKATIAGIFFGVFILAIVPTIMVTFMSRYDYNMAEAKTKAEDK